jgi:S1-C subfamily serine protease
LVVVEYTARNENVSREESGQGVVVEKEKNGDGIILVSGSLFPDSLPKEWVKDIKVRLASKDFASVPAKLLGRTQDRLFAFLKTDEAIDATVFAPGEKAPTTLGQEVYSVALLGKNGGYATYVGVSRVKSLLDLTHHMASTDSFGLTKGMSPVFDSASGDFTGITYPALGETMLMRDKNGMQAVQLIDEDQSSAYLPVDEVESLFTHIPTEKFESPRTWMAVDGITGISEDIRALKGIKQNSGVMIGNVIANEPADKAGLQPQDIVLTIDGKPFSNSPVPELMVMHFSHTLEKHKPGDVVTLGILRDGKPVSLKVTLATAPKSSGEMAHVYSPKIGVTTRDLVFNDAYGRRLPQDTKGVMVALVKTGAPAALGSTPLHPGDLITKVNDQPVDDQKAFLAAMKKIEDAPDMKEAVIVVIQPDGNTEVCHIDLTK